MIDIKKQSNAKVLGGLSKSFLSLALAQQALGFIKDDYYKQYVEKTDKRLNELKGGNNIMETKSRYEVIADLEENKRSLILKRDSLGEKLKQKKKVLKDMKRDIEDKEEEIKDFEESIEDQRVTINELIKSIDESLNRFAELSKKK